MQIVELLMTAKERREGGIEGWISQDRAGLDGLELPQHREDIIHVLELAVDPVSGVVRNAIDERKSRRPGDRLVDHEGVADHGRQHRAQRVQVTPEYYQEEPQRHIHQVLLFRTHEGLVDEQHERSPEQVHEERGYGLYDGHHHH